MGMGLLGGNTRRGLALPVAAQVVCRVPLLVAHKWARWLHNPCRLGEPHRFGAGGRIRGGPQVGKVAT